jgi:hypothetical protein
MSFKSIAEFLALTGEDAPTTAEKDLIEATQAGEDCYLCDEDTPSLPTESTDETRIRAPLLRLLITGGSPACGLHERGVTLVGGWIDGPLDLAYCTARGRTGLNWCKFPDEPRLDQARFQLLSFNDSAFDNGLYAQELRVKGSLFLRRITANGTVDVAGAKVGGQLDCDGARLKGGQDADVGQIEALSAQGVEVGQDLFLRTVTATGTVDVNGAKIGGQLVCAGARLNGGKDAEGGQVKTLNAQGVEVGQSLFLRTLTATGAVDVNGAKIGGQLACEGARLDGGKDAEGGQVESLNAQRMTVAQGFLFRDVAQVTGCIDLTAAHVGDLVDDMKSWPDGPDYLILDGFTYDRTDGPTTFAEREAWLATGSLWQGNFYPQPYTQLASVLRQMGHAGEARKVLMERTGLQAKATRASRKVVPNGDVSVGFHSLWADILNAGHWIIDRIAFRVAGYGHAPVRSLWCLMGLFLAATTLAHLVWDEGSFAPNSDVILASAGWAEVTALDCHPTKTEDCDKNPALTWSNTFTASAETPTQGADWDSFSSYGYAADLVVPFLNLGQTDAWAPSKDRGNWGWWLWWARWVLATLGWIVTGLGVAAVTGVMQRNQPD